MSTFCCRSLLILLLLLTTGCSFTSVVPDAPSGVVYVVQKGDTLSKIAAKHGVTVEAIVRRNKIPDPAKIEVGQTLIIVRGGYARLREPKFKDSGPLLWPVGTGRMVSYFGPRRGSFHDGIDFAAPTGTPVYAAHSGRVVYRGTGLSGYGKLLIIKGQSGLLSIYAHNSEILVRYGDKVRRGQQVAAVGMTGKAEGPHLHFEVRMKDKKGRYVAIDPIPLLDSRKKSAPRYRVNEGLSGIFSTAAKEH